MLLLTRGKRKKLSCIRSLGVNLRQYVRFDLQAIGDPVGGVEEVYHCHDLYHGRVV
jgi:hypothetical protein